MRAFFDCVHFLATWGRDGNNFVILFNYYCK